MGFDSRGLMAAMMIIFGVAGWAVIEAAIWLIEFLWHHLSWS